ncbi:MAG TPA: hypothetical protein VJH88_01420 [Candidatus Nanoarchaeia archaeon]|nr:hypothetical protein [Candidatus Nanoarchaeia archaeon]
MKCFTCGKAELEKKKIEYKQFDVSFGKFDALVCPVCEETAFDGNVSEQIEKKAKELGLWGLAAKTTIGTSGNALDVKIPKSIIEFMKIKKGQVVIIEPIDQKRLQVIVG